jgi:small subunit ribosomal protein S6
MFYECVLIIRPDVSSKYVMEFVQGIQEVIEKSGGKVHATEYWGFRSLAYPIAKRAKAHYVCLGMEASSLEALNHYLKFHKDLLRFLFIKKPKGLEFPTLLLHSSLADLAIEEEEVQTKGDVA